MSDLPARAPRPLGPRIAHWLVGAAMVLLAVAFFFPLVWMVLSSFKSNGAIFQSPFALPESIDLSRWVNAWEVGNLGRYALNSTIVTGTSVFLILLIASLSAFAFSRYRFRGRGLAMGIFALGLLLPLQSYFIAQSNLFTQLEITDTRWALIIPYTAMGLPLATFLLKVNYVYYALGLTALLVPANELAGQGEIGQGTPGRLVVAQDGQPVTGCLGQAHVPGNPRSVDLRTEVLPRLFGHLLRQFVFRFELPERARHTATTGLKHLDVGVGQPFGEALPEPRKGSAALAMISCVTNMSGMWSGQKTAVARAAASNWSLRRPMPVMVLLAERRVQLP